MKNNQLKKLAPVIWSEIQKANKILINLHVGADFDSISSALGMKLILEGLSKSATVFSSESIDPDIVSKVGHKPGFSQILFKDFFQIDLLQYDLFICLDIDQPSRLSRTKEAQLPFPIPTIVIDHHKGNKEFGNINFVETQGCCTSEMIYWLCTEWNLAINKDAALWLYIGIWADTGQFSYPGTTSSDSFRAAEDLIDIGQIDFPKLVWELNSLNNKLIKAIGLAQSRLKEYFNGKVVISTVSRQDMIDCGLDPSSVKTVYVLTNHTLSYSKDSSIAVVIYENQENHWGVSLRSNNMNDTRDVNIVAKQFPNGGGHARASGAGFKGTLAEAQSAVLQAIQNSHPDLGNP